MEIKLQCRGSFNVPESSGSIVSMSCIVPISGDVAACCKLSFRFFSIDFLEFGDKDSSLVGQGWVGVPSLHLGGSWLHGHCTLC